MSKISQIKTYFINALSDSSSHGLPNFFKTKRLIFKLMWFLLFNASVAFGCFMIQKTVFDYLDYEVVTKIDIINESPTQFPTVTFYNLNKLSVNYKNYSLKDILIKCNFNGYSCDYTDFEEKKDKLEYVYYQFNNGRNSSKHSIGIEKSVLEGKTFGFSLQLFAGLPLEKKLDKGHISEGYHVIIHNHSSEAGYNGGLAKTGVDLPIGFETTVIVKRIFSSKLGEPYNKCIKDVKSVDSYDSSLFRSIINKTGYKYRQKDCFDYCLGQKIIVACPNETILFKEFYETKPVYLLYKAASGGCIQDHYYSFILENINQKCSKYCPLECDSISYETTNSFAQYPSLMYANVIKNDTLNTLSKYWNRKLIENITAEELHNYLVAFNVYYEALEYTIISEVPNLMIIDLVSNIGGLMGLFVGISFLSFGEVIEMIFEVLFILSERINKSEPVDD